MKAIERELKKFNIPQILVDLYRNQKTGTLTVNTGDVTKKVYMEKGNAIFASSTDEDERLGETLIKLGKITIEQYDRSVELLKETGKRQGTILVELGYLTPKDLVLGVKSQVREIIYSLFLVEDAEYEFDEGGLPTREVITLLMSMGNLIYDGIKRINNIVQIKREMPDMNAVLRLNKDPESFFQDIVFSHRDKAMLTMIDGTKTVKEIIDSTSTATFEAMKTLYVLYAAGFVEKLEKSGESEEQTLVSDELVQALGTEEDAFEERVNELYSNLYKFKPHDLLEIDEKSDATTVERNFYRLTKEFHPDQYAFSTDPLMLDKLIIISEEIQKAYMLLKEDDKRNNYFQAISKNSQDTVSEHHAEEKFKSELSKVSDEIFSSREASDETKIESKNNAESLNGMPFNEPPAFADYNSFEEQYKGVTEKGEEEVFTPYEATDEPESAKEWKGASTYDTKSDEPPTLLDYTVEEQYKDSAEQMDEEIPSSIKAYLEPDNEIFRDDSDVQEQIPGDTHVNEELADSEPEDDKQEPQTETIGEVEQKDEMQERRRYSRFKVDGADLGRESSMPFSDEGHAGGKEAYDESLSGDAVNRQLLNLVEEIKVLLQELRKELPGAIGPQVTDMEEQREAESTKGLLYRTADENIVLPEKRPDQEQKIQREESKEDHRENTPKKKKLKLWHVLIPVLFLITATVSFLFIYTPEKQNTLSHPAETKKATLTPAQKTQEALPPPAPKVKEVSPIAPTQAVQHTIELIAKDSTWLSATIDEKGSKEMILKPGEQIKWTAKNTISLIIGNAEGLKVIFDGKELGPLGGKGKVVRLKLPSHKNS